MNIYLAAASADRFAARLWIDWLNNNGHDCHDWTRNPGYQDHDRFMPSEIIESNLDALRQAEAFIYLVSETPSTGAGHELGWAVRAGLPCCCVPLCDEFPPQNVSIHQDGVHWAGSISEALTWFEEQPEDLAEYRPPMSDYDRNGLDVLSEIESWYHQHRREREEVIRHNEEHPFESDQRKIPVPDWSEFEYIMSKRDIPF